MRVCPRHHELIGKNPVPSHLGVKLPATPATPGSPRRRRTLHRRGLEKLALNSGITGRSAKNGAKCAKKPLIAVITRTPGSRALLCCTTGMSINSAMNESEAPPLLKRNLSLHDHRASIAAESGTTRPAQQGHRPPEQRATTAGPLQFSAR